MHECAVVSGARLEEDQPSVDNRLFDSDLWKPVLKKFGAVTGLAVELFGVDGTQVVVSDYATPLATLFREYGFEPGLFAGCARRCLQQTSSRPAVMVSEAHGLTVVGTSLMLDDTVVGAAVAGYAFAGFPQITPVQNLASLSGAPFDSLWNIARQQQPVPERRLLLQGELLQVLGDALLREHHRTRQYETVVGKLEAAAAAKDEFLAVISHELRTPLAPILGWASILKSDQTPALVRKAAEAIERNVLLQKRMVDDLRDTHLTARGVMRLDLKVLELAPCVRAALEANALELGKKSIRLEVDDAGTPLFVKADNTRLMQIFCNVISNAVKFTPAGGSIRIAFTRETESAKVVITDSGVGISPEFLPHVFEMFRQQESGTERQFQGLGIGLALAKRLTELQRGSVTLTSAGTGHGTEVTVRLPLVEALESAIPAPFQAIASLPTLAGLSLLVVDDVEDGRETLRELLQHLGAKVCVAGDCREGLVIVREAEPDVVLCDLRMPRMDGFEFIRQLNSTTSPDHPPVVAVTALTSEADHQRTREAGFDGHIDKPYDESAILGAVLAALQRHPHAHRTIPATQTL